MLIPQFPHRRIFDYLAAATPSCAALEEQLKKFAVDGLLTTEEIEALVDNIRPTMPAPLKAWVEGGNQGPAPVDDETLAWVSAQGIGILYDQLAVQPIDSRDPDFKIAWSIFCSYKDREVIEAVGLAYDAVDEFSSLLTGAGPIGLPATLQCYFSNFHDHFALPPSEHDEWVCRLELRAKKCPIYRLEARAKRIALSYPAQGSMVLAVFGRVGMSIGLPALLKEVKREIAGKMIFEAINPENPDCAKTLASLAFTYEKLDRLSPEPPGLTDDLFTRLRMSVEKSRVEITRAQLLKEGRLSSRVPLDLGYVEPVAPVETSAGDEGFVDFGDES